MLLLPTFRAALTPCPVGPAAFTPHPQGSFCGQCQRVVQDFSQSTDPVADLAAARAAAVDGRVCGRFGAVQVAAPPPPKLTQRLRWFVVALVLVVAQGLSAREALAQVRRPVPHKSVATPKKHAPVRQPKHVPEAVPTEAYYEGEIGPEMLAETALPSGIPSVYTYVEQMPEAPQGGGMAGLVAYVHKNLHVSRADLDEAEGRAFVEFVVTETGTVADARIVKSSGSSGLDAAVLQAARSLSGLLPGRQNGRTVKVKIILPIDIKPQ